MVKVKIWVRCEGWAAGGYENTLYFKTEKEAKQWAGCYPHVTIKEVERVTLAEFAEDYIGELH